MSEKYWTHFTHEADIGVRGVGQSKEEAFEQAALAMTAVITDPEKVTAKDEVEIRREAADDEILFADWLNALVYEMATRQMLFSRFEVHLNDGALQAKAWGEKVEVARHEPAVEVKGATYTNLAVKRDENDMWVAQCVVDV